MKKEDLTKYERELDAFEIHEESDHVSYWGRGPNDYAIIYKGIENMISWIGDNPDRRGLEETPERVVKSWAELFSGYRTKVEDIFKVFDVPCDEMVLMRGIEFTSFCEHHMLPFQGVAHVAYLPQGGKVIGASKLARVVDAYAKRLQVQERLTQQVVDALVKYLNPRGAACVVEASHMCMSCRGVKKNNAVMVTSSLYGPFKEDPKTRQEFYQLIRSN